MSDSEVYSITKTQHEIANNALAKAAGIVKLAMVGNNDPKAVSDALWAADDLIDEAREAIGPY